MSCVNSVLRFLCWGAMGLVAMGLAAMGLAAMGLAGLARAEPGQEIRVGVYMNAPKISHTPEGQAEGILVDLLNRIASEEKWRVIYVPCAWQVCLTALEAGDLDLMPDVAQTPARAALFDFHDIPVLRSWSQLYVPQGSRIESVLDLNDRRIAVLAGSVQESAMRALSADYGVSAQVVPTTSIDEAFALARERRVDAAIANVHFGRFNAARYELNETPIVFNPAKLYYATAKGKNQPLMQAIDRHLAAWQANPDSFYFATLKHWRAAPVGISTRYLWTALALLGLLLTAALALSALLRRRVTQQVGQLKVAHARMLALLDAIPDLLFEVDHEGRYLDYHTPRSDLLVVPPDQLIGKRVTDTLPESAAATVMSALQEAAAKGYTSGQEIVLDLPQGQRWFELSVARKTSDAGSAPTFIVLSRDITRRKQSEDDIRRLALFDTLTGLPNRRLMLDRLTQALSHSKRHQQRGALLILDLDNFKELNDTLGHEVGDQLLQEVAERLRTCVRDTDSLAHPGGDEFVVLLEDLGADNDAAAMQARLTAEKIQAAVALPYALRLGSAPGQETCRVHETTGSIGVSMFGDSDLDAEEILKRSETAMYQSKAAGRHLLRFFDPQMHQAVLARNTLELELRQAAGNDQLRLHLQAQVNQAGRVVGAEALLRWQHPQHGLVAPGEFIPLAEQTGLILPIGQWVLDAACRQLARWSAYAGTAALTLAVNVSARQFRQADFVQEVRQALQRHQADPRCLKLELTESLLVHDIDDLIGKMTELQALGVSFSLDDFGTGYSSLTYLKRLPLDQLKIDQSFVHDVLVDPNDATIAQTIVALGQNLGLSVIAEGVESAEQRDFLATIGCTLYQGYYFSRPLPEDDFARYLDSITP